MLLLFFLFHAGVVSLKQPRWREHKYPVIAQYICCNDRADVILAYSTLFDANGRVHSSSWSKISLQVSPSQCLWEWKWLRLINCTGECKSHLNERKIVFQSIQMPETLKFCHHTKQTAQPLTRWISIKSSFYLISNLMTRDFMIFPKICAQLVLTVCTCYLVQLPWNDWVCKWSLVAHSITASKDKGAAIWFIKCIYCYDFARLWKSLISYASFSVN